MICTLHYWYGSQTQYSKGWYIAVEFYFVLSGFLLAAQCEKKNISGASWVKSEIKKLYPYYFYCLNIMLLMYSIRDFSAMRIIDAIPEELMLQMTGLFGEFINVPAWYISAWLIVGFFFVGIGKRYTWAWKHVIIEALPLLIYPYIFATNGHLDIWINYNGIFTYGILRAIAGMAFGECIYYCGPTIALHKWINNRVTEVVLCCIPIIGSFIVPYTRLDFVWVLIFGLAISASYHDRMNSVGKSKKVINFLGKASFPIYLAHYFILVVFQHLFSDVYQIRIFILFLVAVIIYSLISYRVVELLTKKLSRAESNRKEKRIA